MSLTKSIALVLMFALLGCTTIHEAAAPRVTPTEIPMSMSTATRLTPIDLVAPVCSYISAELRFPRSAFPDVKTRDALIGHGTPISMRISISQVRKDGSGNERLVSYESWESTKDGIEGWANDYVFRIFGGTTIPSGSYRVDVQLLQAHADLERIRPTFAIVSNFKNSPDRSRC